MLRKEHRRSISTTCWMLGSQYGCERQSCTLRVNVERVNCTVLSQRAPCSHSAVSLTSGTVARGESVRVRVRARAALSARRDASSLARFAFFRPSPCCHSVVSCVSTVAVSGTKGLTRSRVHSPTFKSHLSHHSADRDCSASCPSWRTSHWSR